MTTSRMNLSLVDTEIKATRAKAMAQADEEAARLRVEELANDNGTQAAEVRQMLDIALGASLPAFLDKVRYLPAALLKHEILHLDKVHAAREHLKRIQR